MVHAGHPPPLVVDPSATARFFVPRRDVALGPTATAVHESATVDLPTGSLLLLYTDGLVENRGEPIAPGLGPRGAAAEGFDDPDPLCAMLVENLVAAAPADDVAFIAARVPPLP